MVIGVPTFAVIYYLIKSGVEYLLRKKELPVGTQSYTGLYRVDEEEKVILYCKKGEGKAELQDENKSKEDVEEGK